MRSSLQIGGETISVKLKSPHWEEECERELKQSRWMVDSEGKYNLLRDDTIVQFDVDGKFRDILGAN